MGRCRYLSDKDYCKYWDEQLDDYETIRCEAPGGWSEECYVEDSRGSIFDPDTGKILTKADWVAGLEEKNPLDRAAEKIVNLLWFDKELIQALQFSKNAPKGND